MGIFVNWYNPEGAVKAIFSFASGAKVSANIFLSGQSLRSIGLLHLVDQHVHLWHGVGIKGGDFTEAVEVNTEVYRPIWFGDEDGQTAPRADGLFNDPEVKHLWHFLFYYDL